LPQHSLAQSLLSYLAEVKSPHSRTAPTPGEFIFRSSSLRCGFTGSP
jgi:hypothetical protein